MRYFTSLLIFVVSLNLNAQTLTDSIEVEAFLDGAITTQMAEHHIAGATLSLVKDGRVVLAKGYGFADIQNQIPVDPERTFFRIGSISKMFTWIAVMQLFSQGKLDLNVDINTYLADFKIPEKYGTPVTLKHLMTHTPGFEDRVLGLFAEDPSKLLPLGEILKNELPERVRPPYTQASYSNHGTGMAAYIVEKVSGMSFHDYVEQNILQPLDMGNTTFRQPLPDQLKQKISKGYSFKNELVEKEFEYIPLYPVGAASTSALDMTHFMLALLNNGSFNQSAIIDSSTLSLMQSPAHQHHPAVNPMRYGFMDMSQNGIPVIGHGGDTFWFHSLMALLPDHQTGLFLSFNTDGGGEAYLKVLEIFMDRYFPDTVALPKPLRITDEWLEQFTGEYRINRFTHSDITKLGSLFGRVKISVDSSRLAFITDEETVYYVPIDSMVFREEFKNDRIVFAREDGNVEYIYFGLLPIFALEKVSGIETAGIHTLAFIILLIATLFTLSYWPLVSIVRKHYEPGSRAKATLPMVCKITAWTNYLFYLIFLVGVMASLADPVDVVYGISTGVKALFVIPFLMILLTAGMAILSIGLLRDHRFRLRSQILYVILTLLSVIAIWQLNYWNFLGFKFG